MAGNAVLIDPDEVTYKDFVEEGTRVAAELRVGGCLDAGRTPRACKMGGCLCRQVSCG